MTQHIGIVGCSAEGAALCYRTICIEGAELLGGHDHPEVSVHTYSLGEYVRRIDADDWGGVGELMLGSAEKLARCGADFLICPDNTIHQALPFIEGRSPLPWLHISAVVASESKQREHRKAGLLGTRWLVESDVYPEKLAAAGLECVRPDRDDRAVVSHIIMEELVRGIVREESLAELQRVIRAFEASGCDAVILGCTELPLVLDDRTSPLPTLDSTRLLARAALRRAIG
jgi:aspartate racemase